MKKIILMSIVLVTLFACDKKEFQAPEEKQEIEEFKEKYKLDILEHSDPSNSN
ncbi:hypothetical protein [Sphingobacterium sp. UDSM-2020]|uniref:hypothetical protein n=1 Tax=Sphingobacterium sp. UDSM-2020 TaxID=2795738 RepID=UPI00193597B8|nr:hypothetical protein [Sphingobacterium sp. UDSM-2020]QQD13381.1 hypothetical protein JAZ75_22775 [Sphingobacterium sp. UDSM-2020]